MWSRRYPANTLTWDGGRLCHLPAKIFDEQIRRVRNSLGTGRESRVVYKRRLSLFL